jgi:23S rRNA pseudouridine1911/1915/1917 synthase
MWTVKGAEVGTRLDKFLAANERLGSRGRAVSAIERGKVFLNEHEVSMESAGKRLEAGDVVRVWMDRPGSSRPRPRERHVDDLHIIYEDDALIVVNKPPGLLSVPLERLPDDPSIYDLVKAHLRKRGRRRALVVHRIDRDTSGLVLFAKNARAQQILKEQFKRREPERVYRAVVYGHPRPPSGTWKDRFLWDKQALIQKETHPRDPKGTDAISDYQTIETFPGAALIEVRLQTGKRNQIRLQARLRGHMLVGEKRYTYGPESLRTMDFGRQALHAWRLAFRHPLDERRMEFEAPLPPDFADLLKELRRQGAGAKRAGGDSRKR